MPERKNRVERDIVPKELVHKYQLFILDRVFPQNREGDLEQYAANFKYAVEKEKRKVFKNPNVGSFGRKLWKKINMETFARSATDKHRELVRNGDPQEKERWEWIEEVTSLAATLGQLPSVAERQAALAEGSAI